MIYSKTQLNFGSIPQSSYKYIFTLLALFSIGLIKAQSTDQNYIKTTTYKGKVATNPSYQITYFDGLGRPIQKVDNAQSNSGKDIITHIEYDVFGRQAKEFLPFVSSTGTSLLIKANEANSFYSSNNIALTGNPNFETTLNPYSEKGFEASPLNRVLKQAAPGDVWMMNSGHEIKFDYLANTDADAVKRYAVTTNWNSTSLVYDISISSTGNYPAKELYKTVTKDENWTSGNNNTTEEYKNKQGNVVLKRTYNAGIPHNTYYVYDQYGNLTYVLPPLAEGAFDTSTLEGLCYQYKYDHKNRLVEKKLPGKQQWEFIVYDKLDRVVASGPALSPFSDNTGTNGWLITKYDAFNRPVLTAWEPATVTATTRKTKQDGYNTTISETKTATTTTLNGVNFNYTNTVTPTSGYHVLSVNYYDDYNFLYAETIPTAVLGESVYYNNTLKPKGLPTGSWVRALQTTTTNNAEKSTIFYDYKARPIRTKTVNYLGGYTQVDTQLDFIGKPLVTETRHKRSNGDAEMLIKEEFTYSAQDRLLTHTHQINGDAKQLLASNTYDELGQLITKKVGGTDATGAIGLQKVDYKYNIRGWLKEINDINNLSQGTNPQDLFAFKLNYNDNKQSNLGTGEVAVKQLFNGNISEAFWKTTSDNQTRKYGYNYDHLNRLTNATFQNLSDVNQKNSLDEILSYDKNGNIKTLSRYTSIPAPNLKDTMDELTYDYHQTNKNQLIKVTDTKGTNGFNDGNKIGDDYLYDLNGNMKKDLNKGITTDITYNHLNLPVKIVFPTGNIEYLYNAAGQKIKKTVTENAATITDYLGGFQYKTSAGVVALDFFPHAEGYVKKEISAYTYVFNHTDHLGNIRVSYKQNGSAAQILEENNYYPFGLKHGSYNTPNSQPNYKYKYNGKELQDELGLNMYDYGARNYDAAIGRWMNMDPLAELSRRFSPYTYAKNNPIYFIDPDGMLDQSFIDELIKKSGDNTTWTNNNDGTFTGKDNEPDNSEENKDGDKDGDKKRKNKTSEGKIARIKGNGENINYFDEKNDSKLFKVANKERIKQNILKLFSHSSEYSFHGYQTVEDIEALLYRDSEMWRNFIDNGGTLTIQMISCDSGDLSSDGSPIALEIVQKHPGLTITAASDWLYPTLNGKTLAFKNKEAVWHTFTNNNGKIETNKSSTRNK